MVAADQWTYIWAASEGPVPPLSARKKLHTEFNTIGLYKTLLPVVTNYDKIVGDTTGEPTQSEYELDITNFISNGDDKGKKPVTEGVPISSSSAS